MKKNLLIFLLGCITVGIPAQNKKYTTSKNIFGEIELKDEKGLKTTIRKHISGEYEIHDSKGNKSIAKKNIFGEIEIKDNKGNKTTIRENINGDIEIRGNSGTKTTIKKNNDIFSKDKKEPVKTNIQGDEIMYIGNSSTKSYNKNTSKKVSKIPNQRQSISPTTGSNKNTVTIRMNGYKVIINKMK
jgi:hypothetical protein